MFRLRYEPQELILAKTATRWPKERGSHGQRDLLQHVRIDRLNLATNRNLDYKRTPSILGEQDEWALVLQVREAVDVVLESAAEQMGVDKSALARILRKNGLLSQPGSSPLETHYLDQWDLRR